MSEAEGVTSQSHKRPRVINTKRMMEASKRERGSEFGREKMKKKKKKLKKGADNRTFISQVGRP